MAIAPMLSSDSSEAKVSSLLLQAEEALEEFPPNCELAVSLFESALAADPNNAAALDAFGELLANLGDTARAVQLLTRSAQLDPKNGGGSKFFYLGQMLTGRDSLEAFRRCIHALESSDIETVLDKACLVSAHCMVGELFMTDLCDEEEAELECQSAFQRALSLDSQSVEALSGLASFHRVKLEIEEAKRLCEAAVTVVDTEVPLTVRMRLAENLVDLEMVEDALFVIATILDEDEEDVQAWFLAACCHLVGKEVEEAAECVAQAKRLLKKNRSEIDPDLFQHWTQSLAEINQRLHEMCAKPQ